MKSKILLFSLLSAAVITGTSCLNSPFGGEKGSGNLATEQRTVPSFKGVEMATCAEVILSEGPQSVKIEGDDNIVPLITTDVKSDVLVINQKGNFNTKATLKIYVSVPALTSAIISGSGNIKANNLMHSGNLVLKVVGSGSMQLDVEAKSIESKITGSGNITLSGKTEEHNSKISGSGDILASNLQTTKTDIKVSGSGTCKVEAKETLTVDISGSGNVLYRTTPGKVNSHISGSGEVKQVD